MRRAQSVCLVVLLICAATGHDGAQVAGDWPSVGRDPGAQRFSPLTQLNPKNVATLERAWSFDVGSSNLEVTPLVVAGMMYLTGGSSIFALEPETGRQLWRYDAPGIVSRRGVAYWPGDGTTAPRLFSGAGDGRMVALDARTGSIVARFGQNGFVDLREGIRGGSDGRISLVSPPAVYRDIVITGGNNNEGRPSKGLYGDIRGWSARTGALLWSFHTVPREGEPGADTWEGGSWRDRSGVNMWSFMTIDEERGLVFAPLGSPTSDYYGADRPGMGLYGNSIVALDARTGRLAWYRQLVHHDLWDFDLPAAPTLIDVTREGRTIPAVAVVTKMNTLFIFDRVTGEPIFGMEERPVPQSTVPGERTWPTQPFPIKPEPLGRIAFDPARDFNTLDPEHEAYCRQLWDKNGMYTKGPFTPPGLDGTMVTFPSTLGGGNWNGIAYDPSRRLMFTNIMNLGQVARMQEQQDPQTGQTTYWRVSPWGGPVGRFWNPETKIPCSAPPFGELVAIRVDDASIAWKVPLGQVDSLKAKGFDTGTLSLGGGIVTASGLLFIGATIDGRFRAFDSATGRLLWETVLDAPAHSVPMTFMGKDGRQYVVVAAGGGSFLLSKAGTQIVAFALPDRSRPTAAVRAAPATTPAKAPAGAAAARSPAPGSKTAPPRTAPVTSPPANRANVALPPGDGRSAVLSMCGGCHGLATVVAERRTAKQWQTVVQQMVAIGAPGNKEVAASATAYLAWRLGKVNVNTATEDDLVRILEIPSSQAAAIVEYRQHEGGIRSIADLSKVPGVDATALARKQDRVAFEER